MTRRPDFFRSAFVASLLLAGASASAFVTVRHDQGAWSFENESGKFLSFGINGIRMTEYWPGDRRFDAPKKLGYYDVSRRFAEPYRDWSASIRQRFEAWGFNTAGAWSSVILQRDGLLYCHVLPLGWAGQSNRLVDLFNPAFADYADRVALRECVRRKDDANLVGYFLDNELPWYGTKAWPTGRDSLLLLYSQLPAHAPGRAKLLDFLQARYATWELFRADFTTAAASWSELARSDAITAAAAPGGKKTEAAWAGEVAARFYAVAAAAIRRYDPHHLLLGSRFAGNAPAEVWQAAGAQCEVLSVNFYPEPGKPTLERWRGLFALTGRPLLISETSVRAVENSSGDKNLTGSGARVATQAARAAAASQLLEAWLREPYVVGIHWFEYADQPPGGRAHNGENSNYGLVDIHDQPYDGLISVWRQAAQTRTAALAAPKPADRTP